MAQPKRAVHDTNVVRRVLVLPNPESHWLFQAWLRQNVIPIVNPRTLAELKDHFIKRGPPHIGEATRRANEITDPYLRLAKHLPFQPAPQAPLCQDQADQKFLALAYTGGAEYLVTQDKALLALKTEVPFAILTPAEFRQELFAQFPNFRASLTPTD